MNVRPEGMETRDLYYDELLKAFSPDPLPDVNEKEQETHRAKLRKKLDPRLELSPESWETMVADHRNKELNGDEATRTPSAREALLAAVNDIWGQNAHLKGRNISEKDYAQMRRATALRWNKAVRKAKWQLLSPLCKVCLAPVFAFVCSEACRPKPRAKKKDQ